MDKENNAKSIKPINVDTVHKICSGQVVLSLAVAVKELVENSLDAGATSIDVRLKNYGLDLIEVSDNGSGVTEDNFAALTLKYHTSKLSEYSDLLGVSSFGFRGEALSSLCLLSNLIITTRHQSSQYATKIEYDSKGNIVKTTPCSRQVGTTVTLSNLFSTLPVRQKEFQKNAKREFNKMTQLLYAYCLISVGVKINCTNQTSSNAKSVVVSTQGSKSYKDNIACIFGSKQLQTILELKPDYVPNIKENILKGLSGEVAEPDESMNIEDVEIDLSEDSNDVENPDDTLTPSQPKSQGYKNVICPVEFDGFISSCAHGSGRSSTDRQFYFVNSRPCEPPKIMKLINEVYKQYNSHQYPFVFLNVHLDRTSVDVNVTPDKRKVFLTKEKIILDVLKSSMLKIFESIPRTLKVEPLSQMVKESVQVKPELEQPRIFTSFLQKFASKTNNVEVEDNLKSKNKNTNAELKRKSTSMLDFVSTKTMKMNDHDPSNEQKDDEPEDIFLESPDNSEIISDLTDEQSNKKANDPSKEQKDETEDIFLKSSVNTEIISDSTDEKSNIKANVEIEHENNRNLEQEQDIKKIEIKIENIEDKKEDTTDNRDIMFLEYTDELPNTQIRKLEDVVIAKSHTIVCKTKNKKPVNSPIKRENIAEIKPVVTDKEDLGKIKRKSVTMKTCFEHVKALTDLYNKQNNKTAPERVKFRSGINPVFNKKCEEELSKEISKESFKEMKVLGQFNLGFIITKLEDDLFIIDQHATDEIYNFETLQKNTELTSQKLVIPQQLELTGVNEQILMDHLPVFKKNGFTFQIDEDGPPTKRVKLLTVPMSKNWVFGKEDIEELLFMLRESPEGHQVRPSRVRAMFASRACRRSVMVGAPLAKPDMKTLVDHMAEIERPWNCPHGRPTIRHLVNLAVVQTKESSE